MMNERIPKPGTAGKPCNLAVVSGARWSAGMPGLEALGSLEMIRTNRCGKKEEEEEVERKRTATVPRVSKCR